MRHVGLHADSLGPSDGFQQLHHPLPAVHAAPADLAFGREPLAVRFGDVGGLAERLGDPLRVARRILRPVARARGGVDPDHAVLPDAEIAKRATDRAGFLNLRQEFLPIGFVAHCGSAAGRRPDRRDQRSDDQSTAADAVCQPFQVVSARVDARVRVGEKQIDAVELHAVHGRGSGHVQHRVERDGGLTVGTLPDETRPHCVVQCRVFVHFLFSQQPSALCVITRSEWSTER